MRVSKLVFALAAMVPLFACSSGSDSGTEGEGAVGTASQDVRRAAFTSFDAVQGGCLNSPNGINCNLYEDKEDVYINGGPLANVLDDGAYFWAVLVPGYQNGGFLDGAMGNLSDTTAGGTSGDSGSGDAVGNRTFEVFNGSIEYPGTHLQGETPNGKGAIQLFPYDDTSNPGGVYILAICTVGATSPSDCKYDAFKVAEQEEEREERRDNRDNRDNRDSREELPTG